ncbi:hypothetical protein BGZ76_008335 [Entomortierella beljakovae]|nr:hypothetical protein BGZ76_008335 [Entomortierella beljakovae]
MDVAQGLVDCDWRVDITSCRTSHEKDVIRIVLIVCVCCYLVLASIGYGILWTRKHYNLTPPGPIIDFRHPDGGVRPKPIESFCALSIAGLLVRAVSIIFVIVDAFPHSTTVQELLSELAVCCSFPCWACFVIGVWYATPKLSSGDNLKFKHPTPSMINFAYFCLVFGPFLLDLPSVISSGTFLAKKHYTESNIAIAVHFITLGGVLLVATAIYFSTLDQLAKAIKEYTVPSGLTMVHVVSPSLDISGSPAFTLSPPTEKEQDELWGNGLRKERNRLISIRNAGTIMLSFYVIIYLTYGIARPLIHSHISSNVIFCVIFNLDPGIPTIYAYFIFSIIYRINTQSSRLHQASIAQRPPMAHITSSNFSNPTNDIFYLRQPGTVGVGSRIPQRTLSDSSMFASSDLSSLGRFDSFSGKYPEPTEYKGFGDTNTTTTTTAGAGAGAGAVIVDIELPSPVQKSTIRFK